MTPPVRPEDRFFLLFEGFGPPVTALWGFRVEGELLDEARLRSALAQAFERHPKAASHLGLSPPLGTRLHWKPCPGALAGALRLHPPRDVSTQEVCAEWMNLPLEAAEGPLIQVHWQPHSESTATLGFRFHHALADGLGALSFLRDLLKLYHGEPLGPPPPSPFSARPLVGGPARSRFALFLRMLRFQWRRARAYRFAPAAKLFPLHHRPSGRMDAVSMSYEGARLSRWLQRSKELGFSFNDLLLAGHALGLSRWRAERGLPGGTLRFMVNQNLRSPGEALVLENRSSAFPVWIAPPDLALPGPSLAARLHAQTQECQELKIAEGIALFAEFLRLPLALARLLILPAATRPQLADSLILSNLGRLEPLRLGMGKATSCHAYVRPPEGVGALCLASTMGDRLTLNWCFLEGLLERPQVVDALHRIGGALDELCS